MGELANTFNQEYRQGVHRVIEEGAQVPSRIFTDLIEMFFTLTFGNVEHQCMINGFAITCKICAISNYKYRSIIVLERLCQENMVPCLNKDHITALEYHLLDPALY